MHGLIRITQGEGRIIEYRAMSLSDGRFVSTANAKSHPLDGSDGDRRSVSASIAVGNETSASYPEDGWRPPEWGLDRSDIFDSLYDLTAADGYGGSACEDGSCPV